VLLRQKQVGKDNPAYSTEMLEQLVGGKQHEQMGRCGRMWCCVLGWRQIGMCCEVPDDCLRVYRMAECFKCHVCHVARCCIWQKKGCKN
jgi:hypothetical protein